MLIFYLGKLLKLMATNAIYLYANDLQVYILSPLRKI